MIKSLLSVFICLGLFNLKSGYSQTYKRNNLSKLNEPVSEEINVKCLESEISFNSNSKDYLFETTGLITRVECDGPLLIDYYCIQENSITCQFTNFISGSTNCVKFFQYEALIDEIDFYFAIDAYGWIYSSCCSLEKVERDAGLIIDTCVDINDFINTKPNSINSSGCFIGVKSGEVCGRFTWLDDEGNIHPLVDARITIKVGLFALGVVARTDENGEYQIKYENFLYFGDGTIELSVWLDDLNSICVNNYNGNNYRYQIQLGTADFINYSYTFSPSSDGDFGKSLIIFQTALQFADYALKMNDGVMLGKCTFFYPSNPKDGSYNFGSNVFISGERKKRESLPTSYSSVDLIGHEYGHFVQFKLGLNTSLGGFHILNDNIIDTRIIRGNQSFYYAKDQGIKCSWGEGWATYFSIIAQKAFSNHLKGMFTLGDDRYTSYNGADFNLDAFYNEYRFDAKGDGDEVAVSRILFKLQSSTIDEFDKFAITNDELWRICLKYHPHTFFELTNGLISEGYDKFDLGVLLKEFNICLNSLTVENSFLDTCPIYKWSTYMGSQKIFYDSFDLIFYDQNKAEVLKICNIETTGREAEFEIDKNSWERILASNGAKYFVSVCSRNTLNYVSGPYYSNWFEFNKPTEAKNEIMVQPSEWLFEPQYFYQSNNYGHTNTTLNLKSLNILTNRLRCGYIENSYIVLSPMRKNAGLAYLELYFDRPVYRFSFEYALWSNAERINALNSSILIEYLDFADEWTTSFNLFEVRPNIPNKDDGFAEFMMCFQNGTYGIRIVMTSPAVGDHNKGRLCLDNLYFLTNNN